MEIVEKNTFFEKKIFSSRTIRRAQRQHETSGKLSEKFLWSRNMQYMKHS